MKHLLLIAILVLGIAPIVTARGQEPQLTIQGVVVQSSNDALIQRAGWTEFTHLSVGASLHSGDLINPKTTAIRVICADLNVQIVTRLSPVPCAKERAIFHQNNTALAGWQRGKEDDPRIPYLLAPRNSVVISSTPLILWSATSEADSYRIIVRGAGLEWTAISKGGTSTSLRYPKDAPKLEPGKAYTVEVVALAQGATLASSTEEGAAEISFSVMDAQQAANYSPLSQKLHGALADKTIEDFILAQMYMDNNLYADAVALLLPLSVPAGTTRNPLATSPITHLVLGKLYQDIGIRSAARASFESALDLADSVGDVESTAIALEALAQVAVTDSQRATFLEKSLAAWETLGATAEADLVRQQKAQP